ISASIVMRLNGASFMTGLMEAPRSDTQWTSDERVGFGSAWRHGAQGNQTPIVASHCRVTSWISAFTAMSDWRTRITCNRRQCGGRPCIRGMRIRVSDILDLLASGLSSSKILEEMPDLQAEDIEAALRYARSRVDHPVIAA